MNEAWTRQERLLAIIAAVLAVVAVLLLINVALPRLSSSGAVVGDATSTPAVPSLAEPSVGAASPAPAKSGSAASPGASARLEVFRQRIIGTWTSVTGLAQDLELDFTAGDYATGARDAKALSRLASDELKWLRENPADRCYETVWSLWRSAIADVGTAAGLASAFYEGLAGTSPADIGEMQAKLLSSISAMTTLTEELPVAQARC